MSISGVARSMGVQSADKQDTGRREEAYMATVTDTARSASTDALARARREAAARYAAGPGNAHVPREEVSRLRTLAERKVHRQR